MDGMFRLSKLLPTLTPHLESLYIYMSTVRPFFKIFVVVLLLWIFLVVILPAIDLPHAVPGISGSRGLQFLWMGIWFCGGCAFAVMLQISRLGAKRVKWNAPSRELLELTCSRLC
jgi:hypothetical protein